MDDIIETKLNIGDFFEYDNEQFRYFGNVENTKDLPNCNCCYSIGNILYIRKLEKPLELGIKPTDNLLLVEVKKALKGFSPVQFRNLFDSEAEYRNMRRAIEKSKSMSAARFKIIMEKLGVDKSKILYILNAYFSKYVYEMTNKVSEDVLRKEIVYSVPKHVQYEITVQEILEHKNFTATCQSVIINGKLYPLHNEISFTFKINDGKIDIVSGWHTGTEDFIFSKEEGDNCEEYIEDYHLGLLKQLKKKLKEMKYL